MGLDGSVPRSLSVIIADDEPAARQTLQRMLAALGHKVASLADNGQELLDECRKARPDLAIIDLEMPVLDGLAAAEELRALAPVPIILLSGHPDFQQVVRSQEPIEVYLSKPVTLAELNRAIHQAIERATR